VNIRVSRANWLRPPYNRSAFGCVRDFLPVDAIDNDPRTVSSLEADAVPTQALSFTSEDCTIWSINRFLDETYTDALLILRDGRIAFEWYGPQQGPHGQRIIFSVTKSVVGSLTGILHGQGILDPLAPVSHYVPEIGQSGYASATVRNLLDMTVALDFDETPLVADTPYTRYREAVGWENITAGQTPLGIHGFLPTIHRTETPHGHEFRYLSPNSDLLGWVCERAAGLPLPGLISRYVWKPMGAEAAGSITLDANGAPRAAGGLSCTLRDMARFGECMRNGGRVAEHQIIPASWIEDIASGGDRSAWQRGAIGDWLPGGCYRSQWWITHDQDGAYFAAGLYSHWIYISAARKVVIVKQSSPPIGPADKQRFRFELEAFSSLAQRVS